MKKHKLTFLLLAALGGCTTVSQIQSDCESRTKSFPELATCLRASVAASDSGRLQRSEEVKLYLLKADQLSEKVQKKEISELDARVELQQLFVNLRGAERSQAAAASAASAANRPRQTTCYPVGNTVQCNSY